MDFLALPGGELVEQGITDLEAGVITVPALVVSMASTWFSVHGVDLPNHVIRAELELWERLYADHGDAAHARFNALSAQLVSFQRAFACAA